MKLAPKTSIKLALHYSIWVVTTSGIAGFQGISIKYHTLDKDGTQIHILPVQVVVCPMRFTTLVDLMLLGALIPNFLVVSTISETFC